MKTVDAMSFDTAQICLNGDVRNSQVIELPQFGEKHCSICGAKTITACPTCDTPIKGSLKTYPYATSRIPYVRPSFCRECGEPFPWTTAALEAARALADESEGLTEEEKGLLKDSLPDLVSDTPKTPAAANLFKRLAGKAGPSIGAGLNKIMTTVATEWVKHQLGWH